jgi:hypothetical protein
MSKKSIKGLVALEADGVLLDYHAAYRMAWQRASGKLPDIKDSLGYSVFDRCAVPHLEGERLSFLQAAIDEDFWLSVPAFSTWWLVSAAETTPAAS